MLFALGGAVGAVAAWQYAKRKYERIAQEEIDSVKETFFKREVNLVREKASVAKEKRGIAEYTEQLRKRENTDYSKKEEKASAKAPKPYVITPEAFSDSDEYEKISLTYFADQILADDNEELMEDVEGTVGFESLSHFGEYEDDSVFVRNDRLKLDYEILLDLRKYSDVVKTRPRGVE
jgi:hypothetical protein